MIKLTNLILENTLREYSDEEKRKIGIPPNAVSRGGVWYVGDKYIGQVVKGKFVAAAKSQLAATGGESPIDKTKTKVAQTPTETPELDLPPAIKKSIVKYVKYIKEIDSEIKSIEERNKFLQDQKESIETVVSDETANSKIRAALKTSIAGIDKELNDNERRTKQALERRTEFKDDIQSFIDLAKADSK